MEEVGTEVKEVGTEVDVELGPATVVFDGM